jgi:hypothetical protein
MNKIILILFVLLLHNISFGQKAISGIYTNSKNDRGFESDIFSFKKDGTFKYAFFTCTGFGFGIGNYEITKQDSLKLNFKNIDVIDKQDELIFEYNPSDSLKINIKSVEAETNEKLPYVQLEFKKTNSSFSTDYEGIGHLKHLKIKENVDLEINAIGFGRSNISIPNSVTSITGVIKIYPSLWTYQSTDKKTFKVVSLLKSQFTLNRYKNHSIKYVKLSSKKMNDFIKYKVGEKFYKSYYKNLIND